MKYFGRAVGALCALALSTTVSLGLEQADPLQKFVRHYELVTVDAGALAKTGDARSLTIDSPTLRFELDLEPRDLRSGDYRAVETLEDGAERELPMPDVATYAGTAANFPGSEARFTIDERGLTGLIVTGDETYFVEPFSNYSLGGGPSDHVLYGLSDLDPEAYDGTCATTGAAKVLDAVERLESAAKGGTTRVVELATEADDEYVSLMGGASAANAEILSIVNQVDGVYRAELGLTFRVVYQHSYRGGDPYSSTSDPTRLLAQFRDEWNASRSGVRRDLAHLWTGRDLEGATVGLAYIGVLCSGSPHAYGLSQLLSSAPAKHILTAHEIGHNFNACHSDTSCNPNPSSCSNTVMQSSIGSGFTFCEASRDQIRRFVSASGACLGTASSSLKRPKALEARVDGTSQVTLTWLDETTGETGFDVERREAGGSWARVTTTRANATSHTVRGLRPGTRYRFRVRAVGTTDASSWSKRVAATTD
jgi:hypothetical protein